MTPLPDTPPPPLVDHAGLVGEWSALAACAGKPADWFFPERGQTTEPAKAICRTCPVQPDCLEHAIRVGERQGIWGGRSERERRRLRRGTRRAA